MKAHYFFIPLAVVAVAMLGSWLTAQGVQTWYTTLTLPNIAPSGGFIGGVWTIIFILSAVALILIWNQRRQIRHFAWLISLLVANGILNVLWSYLFFVQHQTGWAVLEMLVLNLTTLVVIVWVWRRARTAAWLLLLYFLWVSFATYLAYSIWVLNP